MIKIAYYYQGNKDYIKDLLNHNLTFIVNDEKKAMELIKYNLPIKMLKYVNECYDIIVSETDDIETLLAKKKVVIGTFNNQKKKIIPKKISI